VQTRLRLWHRWRRQVAALLPTARATRRAVLALFVLGALWAGTLSLVRVAAALPLPAADPSTERRLRRWLANPAVAVGELWAALLPALLAGKAGQELLVVFAPTPHRDRFTALCLGLVDHKRVLPLAWRVLPQQAAWPERQIAYLRAMCTEVAAALPPGCTVTLLGDRGVTGPDLIALGREVGWHVVLRVSVSAAQANRVRLPGRPERPLWDLVTGPGQRWAGAVELFKGAGWRAVELTIHWRRGEPEPWVLLSDRPAGPARAREYRRRARAEATYQDCKRRGFDVERSRVSDPARFDRLLLVLVLALWWAEQLGLRAIRAGHRRRFDRTDRRDLGVVRLGRRWLEELLLHDRCPPLPFHHRHGRWRYAYLA
jgi:DDE family transposase